MSKLVKSNNANPVTRRGFFDMDLGDFMDGFFKSVDNNSFKVDIKDKGNHYELKADMPGFDKKDIDVDIENGYLTISANRKEEKSSDDEGYIMNERREGYVARSFAVTNIDEGKVSADYTDGVLKVELPKIKEEKKSNKIDVK